MEGIGWGEETLTESLTLSFHCSLTFCGVLFELRKSRALEGSVSPGLSAGSVQLTA